jgi:hypothetical protein
MSYTNGLDKPTDYFNTKLYAGTNTPQSITGVGFQPDWTWIKVRNVADNHFIYDSVRGATKYMHSDLINAEGTLTNGLTSFDSDGFSLGDSGSTNNSSNTFVAWNWLASNTTASNTDGSITSSVSANTTAGFSIVSWTGTGTASTIGHGLSETPSVIILKNRSVVEGWLVYHHKIASAPEKYLFLNQSNAVADLNVWNDTAPTSSVFSVFGYAGSNGSGNNMIAYCFAQKQGFSKFGKYIGNGNVDGTFVYTGFKPAMIIIKNTARLDNWYLFDNKRGGFNVDNDFVFPDLSNAEVTSDQIDILSNGFKCRNGNDAINSSGELIIYMAFAENPFVTSTGIPTTAR